MDGSLSLRFTTQAGLDIKRITRELTQLQGQVASGAAANDLRGFGGASSRLLNAQGLKASADSRASVLNQLQARFGVQGAALGQVAEASSLLATSIRDAISSNDGRGIGVDLEVTFASVVSALNETWNGQPLFAGERYGAGPIKINSIEELQAAGGPDDIFNEAERHQVLDLGAGAPIVLSRKASELSQGLFDTLEQLANLIDNAGGEIGQPVGASNVASLQAIADQLDKESTAFITEEGRSGQLRARFSTDQVRLQERSNLLLKEIGEQADADLATVSIRLSALLVQYEAAAKTFSDLSKLSLLDYL